MNIHTAPQIIFALLIFIGGVSNAFQHGKPHKSPISFWSWLWSALIVVGLTWWGGFWS